MKRKNDENMFSHELWSIIEILLSSKGYDLKISSYLLQIQK